jgi:hypothetical protein
MYSQTRFLGTQLIKARSKGKRMKKKGKRKKEKLEKKRKEKKQASRSYSKRSRMIGLQHIWLASQSAS